MLRSTETARLFLKTVVELASYSLFVEVLTDKDQLLHAVAVALVPVALQTGILLHEDLQFLLGHRSIPLTGITQTDLLACLLEDVTHIGLIVEPADAFRADHTLRPTTGNKLVEESQVESRPT